MTRPAPWAATVLTLYPEMFPGPLGVSLAGRAMEDGVWSLAARNIRDFATDKHRTVDDTPAGGGPGMVLRADVLDAALAEASLGTPQDRTRWPLIYLSPRGKPFNQAMARRFAACDGLTMLCGRFEGVDQRFLDYHEVEEVSLGDFVLTGGEIAATALIDSDHPAVVAFAQAHGTGSEQALLLPVINATATLRTDQTLITADAGYHSEANLQTLALADVSALIAPHASTASLATPAETNPRNVSKLPTSPRA